MLLKLTLVERNSVYTEFLSNQSFSSFLQILFFFFFVGIYLLYTFFKSPNYYNDIVHISTDHNFAFSQ